MNSYLQPKTDVPMGIAIPVLILAGVTLIMTVIARKTVFGRYVYAIGGNPESAELAGISVKRTIVKVFALMGLLAGVASIVVTARLNAGASVTGTMTELNVIAAAVIGGTSLAGGIGTIYGAVLGAVFMQSLENGMVLLGVRHAAAEDGDRGRPRRRGVDRPHLPAEPADDALRSSSCATSRRPSAACMRSRMSTSTCRAARSWGCSATTAPASRR